MEYERGQRLFDEPSISWDDTPMAERIHFEIELREKYLNSQEVGEIKRKEFPGIAVVFIDVLLDKMKAGGELQRNELELLACLMLDRQYKSTKSNDLQNVLARFRKDGTARQEAEEDARKVLKSVLSQAHDSNLPAGFQRWLDSSGKS